MAHINRIICSTAHIAGFHFVGKALINGTLFVLINK